ncbi:MAG: pterin-4-alpha-carbinolamine dehydratase [Proteobacteria bacterium]|nr:MAG: pterin-4-alpha-carbinolamine dehydratase [Pseudomonadota bacterium]
MPSLLGLEAEKLLEKVKNWQFFDENKKIQRTFTFPNFIDAQNFAQKVGDIAESENHHPDICYGWGYCTVTLYTHKIGGLHENDFIVAAKINQL